MQRFCQCLLRQHILSGALPKSRPSSETSLIHREHNKCVRKPAPAFANGRADGLQAFQRTTWPPAPQEHLPPRAAFLNPARLLPPRPLLDTSHVRGASSAGAKRSHMQHLASKPPRARVWPADVSCRNTCMVGGAWAGCLALVQGPRLTWRWGQCPGPWGQRPGRSAAVNWSPHISVPAQRGLWAS